ncbi:MAG: hypothetical protein HC822_11340 [Oscillochloris sp.]|nr:hypothetical protein [Oscillochloris sp.]
MIRALALLLLLGFLVGCAPADNNGPLRAVQAFVAAIEARNVGAIIAGLEPSDWRAEIGPELRAYLAYLDSITIAQPNYRVLSNDGTVAVVQLTGTVRYVLAASGNSGERPVDLRLEVVRVGDKWYLRQLLLPDL